MTNNNMSKLNGYACQVQVEERGWEQSPESYGDVPNDAGAHLQPLHRLVDSVAGEKEAARQRMREQFGGTAKKSAGQFHKTQFKALLPVMQMTVNEYNNANQFMAWMADDLTPAIKEWLKTSNSRQTIKDRLKTLEKWMMNHGVCSGAIQQLRALRGGELWQDLGDFAPPTKLANKQAKMFTGERIVRIKNRLDDLLNNPDAPRLKMEQKKYTKDGPKTQWAGPSTIRKLYALYHVCINATQRSGETTALRVMDVWDSINRTVTKESASACGLDFDEIIWSQTTEAIANYLDGQRLAKMRQPESLLFGRAPNVTMEWRSLVKDVLGDEWVKGMGLHQFSRNGGLTLMAESGATPTELMAASGNTIAGVQPYIDAANLKGARDSGNQIRYDAHIKLGTLAEATTKAITGADEGADLTQLFHSLWVDASMSLSQIEGEPMQAAPPALYESKYVDGEIVSELVDPMRGISGSSNLPFGAINPQILQLFAELRKCSDNAISAWMDGDTKVALDLLKTISASIPEVTTDES